MPVINRPVGPKERKFNAVLVIITKVAALALGVLATAGYAVQGLTANQALGYLTVGFVLLTLASIQDTLAIASERRVNEAQKVKDEEHSRRIEELEKTGPPDID
jgi:TRAP-type C4-dicarboxylate transport system permease small subunit